jgi:hypothetical protein
VLKKSMRIAIAAAMITGSAIAYQAAPASAAPTAAVAVFGGSANVTGGLCLPGLTGASCNVPGVESPTTTWNFTIPSNLLSSPAVVPGFCVAAGVLNGAPLANAGCSLAANGTVGPNALGVGASCGMSAGQGGGTFLGQPLSTAWITSVGGTIPLIGTVGGQTMVGLVQARPISAGTGQVPCVNARAVNFTIVGVAAAAGA